MRSTTISQSGSSTTASKSYLLSKFSIGGRSISLSSIPATVVSTERWTETGQDHSPGSVSVSGSIVNVTAPTVHTWTVARQRLWVRLSDGKETALEVPETVKVRQGHSLELVLASGRNGSADRHQWAAVWNRSVGSWWQIDSVPPVQVYGRWTGYWIGFYQGAWNATSNPVTAFAAVFLANFLIIGAPLLLIGAFNKRPDVTLTLMTAATATITILTLVIGFRQGKAAVKRYAAALQAYVRSL